MYPCSVYRHDDGHGFDSPSEARPSKREKERKADQSAAQIERAADSSAERAPAVYLFPPNCDVYDSWRLLGVASCVALVPMPGAGTIPPDDMANGSEVLILPSRPPAKGLEVRSCFTCDNLALHISLLQGMGLYIMLHAPRAGLGALLSRGLRIGLGIALPVIDDTDDLDSIHSEAYSKSSFRQRRVLPCAFGLG